MDARWAAQARRPYEGDPLNNTVQDLIDDMEQSMTRRGMPFAGCDMLAYLYANRDRPLQEVRDEVLLSPVFGPRTAAIALTDIAKNPAHEAGWEYIQCYYAGMLIKHPWAITQQHISYLMRTATGDLCPQAFEMLRDYIIANHPDPKQFFSQSTILKQIPDTYDFTGLPTRLPHLAGMLLKGRKVST